MSNLLFSVFPNENFVDIGLYQYGWEQCEPSHSFGPAARNHYIFHYVISGTGTLMADDSSGNTIKYQVKSGQGFMLFPNQINTYIADQDLPWEYTWIEFDGLRAKEIVSTAGLSPDHPVYHAGSKDLRNEMMNHCRLRNMTYEYQRSLLHAPDSRLPEVLLAAILLTAEAFPCRHQSIIILFPVVLITSVCSYPFPVSYDLRYAQSFF